MARWRKILKRMARDRRAPDKNCLKQEASRAIYGCMALSVDEFARELEDVTLLVHSAEDRKDDKQFVIKAHLSVTKLVEHYQELGAELNKDKLEMKFGRKVRQVQRLAALLPRIGVIGPSTPDRRVDGPSRPGERRITGVSWRSEQKITRPPPKVRVGADIEAWCGPCKESTTHSIFAVVDGEPKKVVCQACNARHNFRTEPARTRATPEAQDSVSTLQERQARQAEVEARRKADQRNAFLNELANAETVVEFDASRRFRVGEIIDHPAFGRGKVETVLRSSMVVKFGQGGLKSVMLL